MVQEPSLASDSGNSRSARFGGGLRLGRASRPPRRSSQSASASTSRTRFRRLQRQHDLRPHAGSARRRGRCCRPAARSATLAAAQAATTAATSAVSAGRTSARASPTIEPARLDQRAGERVGVGQHMARARRCRRSRSSRSASLTPEPPCAASPSPGETPRRSRHGPSSGTGQWASRPRRHSRRPAGCARRGRRSRRCRRSRRRAATPLAAISRACALGAGARRIEQHGVEARELGGRQRLGEEVARRPPRRRAAAGAAQRGDGGGVVVGGEDRMRRRRAAARRRRRRRTDRRRGRRPSSASRRQPRQRLLAGSRSPAESRPAGGDDPRRAERDLPAPGARSARRRELESRARSKRSASGDQLARLGGAERPGAAHVDVEPAQRRRRLDVERLGQALHRLARARARLRAPRPVPGANSGQASISTISCARARMKPTSTRAVGRARGRETSPAAGPAPWASTSAPDLGA